MTTEITETTAGILAVVEIGEIATREGWNPRTRDDQAEHDALTASVRAQGILQPLLVERTEAGLVVVDGHRRLLAARAAGIAVVPTIERAGEEGEAGQLAAALAANLRRRGLDPIEEARAFARAAEAGWPQRRIAEAVGCSRRHVSERMRLLRLPEGAQDAISEGALPLAAVGRIETIAKVSPAVAEALASALRAGAVEPSTLAEHPDGALAELADVDDDERCRLLVTVPGYRGLTTLLDPERDAEIIARAAAAGVQGISFGADDMDAARAYGVLVEFRDEEDRYFRRGWVADPEWITDRVRHHIEGAEERARERAAREAPTDGTATTTSEDAGERRQRERREEADHRRQARLANLDLGRRAALAYDEPPALTEEMARALALIALHHHREEAAQGLRLTQERLQRSETRTLKSGETRERLGYAERDEAEEALAEWISRARGPEQIIGRAVQALVAAFHADQCALPRAERRPVGVPGEWGGGLAAPLPDIIAALARPVLPERLAARLRGHQGTAAAAGPDHSDAETA